jgi:adenylate cyclase
MVVKIIIDEIEQDVADVSKTTFVYNDTSLVPNSEDSGLTYERGAEKKGKKLCTCVLYVDIRNSVALTEKHHSLTMGKIYTAFTKAVLKVARYHDGHTRNIIGDRVMVVFPEDGCFTKAVDCAISINHIAQYVIRKQFPGVDFNCGIGIDYGELRIIKVGIQRNGTERGENKGLVWAGYPANIASRLTDNANKTIEKTYFEVVLNPINPRALRPAFPSLSTLMGIDQGYDPKAPFYLSTTKTVEMSVEEFANNIAQYSSGGMFMTGGNLVSFTKKNRKITYPPILMTEAVYNGFKKSNSLRKDIVSNYWTEQKHEMKNVTSKVYGGNVHWEINK